MVRKQYWYLAFTPLLILTILLIGCRTEQPATNLSTGTGIAVAEPFTAFYDTHGGPDIFGYPITDAFTEPQSGRLVQYFERMQLIHEESRPAASAVSIAPLGEWALEGLRQRPPAVKNDNSAARYFVETGETVHGEFLSFYEAHGGERIFGPPISPQFDEGGLRVQYFRNGRLEWHPAAARDQRIQVGKLGQAHFIGSNAVYAYKQQILARPADVAFIREAHVTAAVRAPILYAGDEQTVYVEVTTPEGRPVADAVVELALQVDGITHASLVLGRTDEIGIVHGPVPVDNIAPGRDVTVIVTTRVAGGKTIAETLVTFRNWW